MGGKTDEVKGRIKEAAGALTGNDKLRDEGKTDQAVGKVKQVVQKAVDKVLLANIKKEPHLISYLASTFSLRKGDRPHEMKW